MFAGIVGLDNEPNAESLRTPLRSALSRRAYEEILVYEGENVSLVRASTGALTSYSGLRRDASGTVSLMAGQPLVSQGATEVDHERLND